MQMKKVTAVSLLIAGTTILTPAVAFASTSGTTTSQAQLVQSQTTGLSVYALPIIISNSGDYSLGGTGTANAHLQVKLTDQNGKTVTCNVVVNTNNSWVIQNINTKPLSDGAIKITVSSDSGNTKTVGIEKHTIVPNAPVVSSNADISGSNAGAYTVSGTGTPGDIVNITLKDVNGATSYGIASVGSNSTWSANADVSNLKSGTVQITATQTDRHGNESVQSQSVVVQNDHISKAGVTPNLLPGGGGTIPTGVFLLINHADAVHAGHMAAGIELSNGEIYYESFTSDGNWYFDKGVWMTASNGGYIFQSQYAFAQWLKNSGYDPNEVVFIETSATNAQNMWNKAVYWHNNTPNYNLGGYWDCQSLTDNVMQAGGIDINYFTSPLPNTEVLNAETILTSSGNTTDTGVYDPQWVDFSMFSPGSNSFYL